MTNYFFDSSALVKRYMPELGTAWVRKLTTRESGNAIILAPVTTVEIMSAIARHYHDGLIELSILQAFRNLVMRHMLTQYTVLNLSSEIMKNALDSHERHRLRAYDSVQLASAYILHRRASAVGETIVFVAADTRLLAAAVSEGLSVDNPNNYP